MKKQLLAAALGFAAMLPGQANASVYGDDLTKCLVAKTSSDDKFTLVRWVFVAIAASPKVKDMAKISDAQRESSDRDVATLLTRLMTKDCRKETVAAIKYDGAIAIQRSFGFLGEVAMAELVQDPAVAKGFSGLDKFMDLDAMADVLKEAGVAPSKSTT